jgi:DnaJ-domain-containing protein 1
MPHRSPLDYDVSVSTDKRRRQRRRGMTGAFETSQRVCECEGCERAGLYRAPKSPERLDEFHWFCLDHVREYNRAWNYFENRSEEEIEAYLNANPWHRPTWRFGRAAGADARANGHAEGRAWQRLGFRDPFEVLGDNATLNPAERAREAERARRRRLPANERRALEILGIEDEAGRKAIRARYKALVKDLHPDLNGGRRDDEARLTEVLWAWDQIKDSRNFAD